VARYVREQALVRGRVGSLYAGTRSYSSTSPRNIVFSPDIQQNSNLVLAGAAVAALAGAAAVAIAAQKGGGGSATKSEPFYAEEQAPEPVDVSIPYDAAALLAYREMKLKLGKDDEIDRDEYARFKKLYETVVVADVTAKKKARDLAAMRAEVDAKAKELEAFLKSSP